MQKRNYSDNEIMEIAYKKLKSSVYFDKTQLPLRDQLVIYEDENIEKKLNRLFEFLNSDNEHEWIEFQNSIIATINTFVFPKKLKPPTSDIILNDDNEASQIEKVQYFIDMNVDGHILGVLWIILIGTLVDVRDGNGSIYEHSYGNRLCKSLVNKQSKRVSYSPHLFEPYFTQYQSWRDKALDHAKERLNSAQDVVILTLDFKSFFYSIDIQADQYSDILSFVKSNLDTSFSFDVYKRLHTFVYTVIESYSKILEKVSSDRDLQIDGRRILPIGFLPSNLLANWVLTPFDDAIIKSWNPVYYGRYVDDIIIVDKVEINSQCHFGGSKQKCIQAEKNKIIDYYFCGCPSTRETPSTCKDIHTLMTSSDKKNPTTKKEERIYRLNGNAFGKSLESVSVQNEKIKVFYFRHDSTQALLDCFKSQIAENASEFRYFPDMDNTLLHDDFSQIYSLKSDDSIHKLRGVTGVEIDKFELSKFLGKYRKIGNMIRDKNEISIDKSLINIFNQRSIVDNSSQWERLFEIMIVNDRLDDLNVLINNIFNAIGNLKIPGDKVTTKTADKMKPILYTHDALLRTLRSAITRVLALYWGSKITDLISNITNGFDAIKEKIAVSPDVIQGYKDCEITEQRERYLKTRMVNKYILPLLVDCMNLDRIKSSQKPVQLCNLENSKSFIKNNWESTPYKFYPYIVTPHELSFSLTCRRVFSGLQLDNPGDQKKMIKRLYFEWNYPNTHSSCIRQDTCEKSEIMPIEVIKIDTLSSQTTAKDVGFQQFATVVIDDIDHNQTIKVAIGNALLVEKDFEDCMRGKPNRTIKRYNQMKDLLGYALHERVELLVLPENYLPFEWMPEVVRFCAQNQMALVTGIEHIITDKTIGSEKTIEESGQHRVAYNLTAVILPYKKEQYPYAYPTYHNKVHFSPDEKRKLMGHNIMPIQGNGYHLFGWKNIWFSVYCCYELASIRDRTLFQAYADITIAVEWNRDVTYFSSIIESLCRDIHCYCIQANSSDYGDSRVLAPKRTIERDLIKTKGGLNSVILSEVLNIAKLRDFQMLEYELQKENVRFKPTPPSSDYDKRIIKEKIDGTLLDFIKHNNDN